MPIDQAPRRSRGGGRHGEEALLRRTELR